MQRVQIVGLAISGVHAFRAFLVACRGTILRDLVYLVVLELE